MAARYQERYSFFKREGTFVPLLSNYPLLVKNDNITAAIIAIHGLNENAAGTFDDLTKGAYDRLGNTMIVVPWFHTSTSPYDWGDVTTTVNTSLIGTRWMANTSWISAGDPYDPLGSPPEHSLSSYQILDSFYEYFTQRAIYPNLQQVTYVGFSAGGQMINRYAWASKMGRLKDSSDSNTEVSVKFIVSDASSYLYFNNERPANECRTNYDTGALHTCDTFTHYYNAKELPLVIAARKADDRAATPESTTCKEFDTWKFGTSNMPGTVQGYSYLQTFLDRPDLVEEHTYWYRHKNIQYILGGWDSCNCKAPDYVNAAHCAPTRPDGSYITCAPLLVISDGSSDTSSANNCCDTYPDSTNNDLATSCGSNMQGSNRLQRGLNYISYLQKYYTSSEYDAIRARYEGSESAGETLNEYRLTYAVVDELQHDSPHFYTSDVMQRWLYSLPNITALPTQPNSIFPIPLPMPLLDFSNVAFLALYVLLCLAIGAAISLVLRFHSQQRRRLASWPPRSPRAGNAYVDGSAPNEETYLLL